jgi:hypothetical protein
MLSEVDLVFGNTIPILCEFQSLGTCLTDIRFCQFYGASTLAS